MSVWVEHEVDPGVATSPHDRLHGGDGLGERLHLVLKVGADDACLDRTQVAPRSGTAAKDLNLDVVRVTHDRHQLARGGRSWL